MPRQLPLGTHRVRDHNGRYHIITKDELLNAARTAALDHFQDQPLLDSVQAAVTYLEAAIACQEREVFSVLWLNARHRVLAYEELFFGSIDRAAVHPREVVKAGLKVNAAAVILCHNHPSGACEPSSSDRALTTQLKEVLGIVDIQLIDHIIVAGRSFSFAAQGLL